MVRIGRLPENEVFRISCISRYLVRPTVSDLLAALVRRCQTVVHFPGLACGIPSQGIKRTAGSHPSEGMPQTRPNAWQRISAGGHPLFRICARARGRSPKTLSLGWLPAIRFIPAARVLGDLPPTVDLRRIMGTLSVRSDLTFHRLGSKRDQFLERFTVSN
jgi:hypothetical protein